jgi:hypothetical protein
MLQRYLLVLPYVRADLLALITAIARQVGHQCILNHFPTRSAAPVTPKLACIRQPGLPLIVNLVALIENGLQSEIELIVVNLAILADAVIRRALAPVLLGHLRWVDVDDVPVRYAPLR